ncbi:MAG: ATP-binding protein [Chitinophagaceae bacterium]
MRRSKPYIILLLLIVPVIINAQTRTIDSLKKNLWESISNEKKVKAIFALCELGYTLHPDTLMSYAENARVIAGQLNNRHDEVQAMYYKSGALTTKGLIDSSLDAANACLEILASEKITDPVLQANLFNQKGRCFMRKNQYKEAIDMGYQTINGAEKSNDVLLQIKGKTLIGWAYLEMGQIMDALSWHLKALRTTSDTLLLGKYGILFANLALNYNGLGKTDSAFYFINKAIHYSRKHENLFALSNSLAIKAQLLVRSGQGIIAEIPLKEAVEIRKMIGDPFYIVSDMSQLGLYYANNGQPEKGIAICNEGIIIARKYNIETKLFFLYSSLAENYKASGNTIKYAETLENIIRLKDSVYQKNSAESLAEMQTKYETEKNSNIIVEQKLSLIKKNYWLYGSVGLLVLGIIISYLVFSNYRKKQELKNQLLLKEEKFLSAQAIAKAEENERKRIAADLHDNLGAYAAAIASNVDQIRLHQNHETALQELKINSQSIVSQLNDTIWVLKKDNLSLTAISDRVKTFVQRIGSSYPKINMDVIERINADILLPPAQAFHLFQISKEAIINSLKHSSAKNIRVYFESDAQWKITVSDDGTGMSALNKKMGSGNGVLNMKNRSKEAGWEINWLDGLDGGTVVQISPTTN